MMSRRAMTYIIIAMTLSLLGIGVIQIFWLKASVDQERKNFDDKVMVAIGIVKDKLIDDAKRFYTARDNYNLFSTEKYKSVLGSSQSSFGLQQSELIFKSKFQINDAESYLQNINKKSIKNYIKSQFNQQGIDLNYDYGIYSTKTKGYVILNDNYVVNMTGKTEASKGIKYSGLHDTKYNLSLLEDENKIGQSGYLPPGYIRVFFPEKNKWLWSKVIPSIIMTFLFIALILGCFTYAIYTILRQKHVSQMKTDFINNMTHEFKTPIATISLATDSIANPVVIGNEAKIKRFTNIIKQENERMLNQVEKVLQIAMLDNGEFEIKEDIIDLHKLIGEAINNVSLKIEKRGGTLETQLKASNPIILGDQTHISNIINNLLDNSEKYSPNTLSISVKTYDDDDKVTFVIADKGQGMSREQIKHIFERFYRAHTGNVHDVKGFGLGLSYVKAIVDAHGGEIIVNSEQGKGSSFKVTLPKKKIKRT